MPRPRGNKRATPPPGLLRSLLLLTLALSLASCVGLDATARIGADGSGSLDIAYAVPRMLSPIASIDPSRSTIPFPLSQADFEAAVAAIEGLRLESLDFEDSVDELRVRARIAFPRPAALTAFLDPAGARAIYSEAGGTRTIRLALTEGTSKAAELADPDVARLAATAFAGYSISIAIELPSRVLSSKLSSGEGVRVAGTRTVFQQATTALIQSAQPMIWEIQW